VNCTAIRDALPEHALGVSGLRARGISEHLSRCAACRKESRDLQRAAATLAFALAPSAPPEDLEDRIAGKVRSAAGVIRLRRPRRLVTYAVAAALALAGIGGGAVLAGRDPGPLPPGSTEAQHREDGLNAVIRFANAIDLADGTDASIGVLMPGDGRPGSGSALTLMTFRGRDRAIVIATGLQDEALPYTAWVADAQGRFLKVGKVRALNTSGGFRIARRLPEDLRSFVNVLVRDARGKLVLSGTLLPGDTIPTPAP
jgi:hypothetical protein